LELELRNRVEPELARAHIMVKMALEKGAADNYSGAV
jgi:hypothetical protein